MACYVAGEPRGNGGALPPPCMSLLPSSSLMNFPSRFQSSLPLYRVEGREKKEEQEKQEEEEDAG